MQLVGNLYQIDQHLKRPPNRNVARIAAAAEDEVNSNTKTWAAGKPRFVKVNTASVLLRQASSKRTLSLRDNSWRPAWLDDIDWKEHKKSPLEPVFKLLQRVGCSSPSLLVLFS